MTESSEDKFERTVKRLLSTPPKPREKMKLGKPKAKKAKSPPKRAAKKRG